MFVDSCYTSSNLDAFYVRDFVAHFDEGLNRIEGFACCGIEVNDYVDVCAVSYVFNVLERSVRVHSKTKPHMRRH